MAVIAYLLLSETFRYRSRYIVTDRLSSLRRRTTAVSRAARGRTCDPRRASRSALDQLAGALEVAGAADAQHRPDALALSVPDREGALVDRALDLLVVPAHGGTDVLERRPVGEVGEEVGDLVVGDVGAQHVARGGGALGGGRLLVLDAHHAPVDDRVVLAHVAGGEDALGRRPQAAVAQHATKLAEGQARLAREHDVGHRPHAADDRLRGELAAALGHHALHALAALEAGDLVAADDLDAVLLEHAAEEAPGGGAEAALERMVLEHDHGHAAAELGQRGGDLRGDVRAAHAHHVLGALGLLADAVGVAQG